MTDPRLRGLACARAGSIWPVDAGFTHFTGALGYDPAVAQVCWAELSVDVSSLTMAGVAWGITGRTLLADQRIRIQVGASISQ